jgi:hypothetical protein
MLCVKSPVLQEYVAPGLAVNVTLPPAQNVVVLEAEMVAVVPAFTVIAAVTAFVHPFALVTV